jgi:hypothetical protein
LPPLLKILCCGQKLLKHGDSSPKKGNWECDGALNSHVKYVIFQSIKRINYYLGPVSLPGAPVITKDAVRSCSEYEKSSTESVLSAPLIIVVIKEEEQKQREREEKWILHLSGEKRRRRSPPPPPLLMQITNVSSHHALRTARN